jgi:hypothetical protein
MSEERPADARARPGRCARQGQSDAVGIDGQMREASQGR